MINQARTNLDAVLGTVCDALDARFGKGAAKGDPELAVELAAALIQADAQREASAAVAAAILHVGDRGGFGGWAPALWRMSAFEDAMVSVRRQFAGGNGTADSTLDQS